MNRTMVPSLIGLATLACIVGLPRASADESRLDGLPAPVAELWRVGAEAEVISPGTFFEWSLTQFHLTPQGARSDSIYHFRFWYWGEDAWRVCLDYSLDDQAVAYIDHARLRGETWKLTPTWLVLSRAHAAPPGHDVQQVYENALYWVKLLKTRGIAVCADAGWTPGGDSAATGFPGAGVWPSWTLMRSNVYVSKAITMQGVQSLVE